MTRCIAVLVLCALAGAAPAQDAPTAWRPEAPDGLPTDFDWIRLDSDEWLKGEILGMYDDELEFDSDELGVLTLDWREIRELRSSRIVQIGFQDKPSVVGHLIVDGASAHVIVGMIGDEETEVVRADIRTIIPGVRKELSLWSMKLTFGGDVRRGNTERLDYTARGSLMRRSVKNRVSLDYAGNITQVSEEEEGTEDNQNVTKTEVDNQKVTIGWDYFVTERLFIIVAEAEWYRDPLKNLSSRTNFTTGVGYEIIDTTRTSWSVTAGPGYQGTKFESVEEGGDASIGNATFVVGTDYDTELTKDIDVEVEFSAVFADEESGSYTHNLIAGLEFELTTHLAFNVSWVWDRIKDPTPNEDGIIPEQDDYRLNVGLSWEF